MNTYGNYNKQIERLSKNVNLILKKKDVTNEDIDNLNDYYNELDFYIYHRDYNKLKQSLLEDYYE